MIDQCKEGMKRNDISGPHLKRLKDIKKDLFPKSTVFVV